MGSNHRRGFLDICMPSYRLVTGSRPPPDLLPRKSPALANPNARPVTEPNAKSISDDATVTKPQEGDARGGAVSSFHHDVSSPSVRHFAIRLRGASPDNHAAARLRVRRPAAESSGLPFASRAAPHGRSSPRWVTCNTRSLRVRARAPRECHRAGPLRGAGRPEWSLAPLRNRASRASPQSQAFRRRRACASAPRG